jgi:uncharacterized protein YodC (DUF2158 family)
VSDFKKGDTVRFKSGGPLMTVIDTGNYGPTGPEDGVYCQWFEGTRPLKEVFESAALTISDDSVRVTRLERG